MIAQKNGLDSSPFSFAANAFVCSYIALIVSIT